MAEYKMATNAIHAGYKAESGEPQALPIKQATTYRYYDAEDMAKLFDLDSDQYMYSRLGNPTVGALEEKMTALEGGSAAVGTASGQAANLCAVLNLCQAGDHIISSASIYGGTFNLFDVTLRKLGIETDFVTEDMSMEDIIALGKPNTKVVFGETLANPALHILDFDKFSGAAKALGVPFIVDNTLATPYFCNPFEFGADIITHSTTKYSDGQGLAMGGMVIEKGTFDWAASGKFPGMTEPDESYHGLRFFEKFGPTGYTVKLRAQMLRDLGCPMAPMNAWITYQGLNTLPVRMRQHAANAMTIATFLENHPMIESVKYPGLESDPDHAKALKYMPKGQSGVMTFNLKGGKAAGEKFQQNIKLISGAVHVGDIKTCVLHPASTTHRQMSEQDQINAGIDPGLIRLSVGLEDPEDIIADLTQAFEKI